LDTIEGNARRASDVISQLLTFSRSNSGIGHKQPLLLSDILDETTRLLSETFPPNITLRSEATANLYPIDGDTTQIRQMLLYLCANSRDAMVGGGTITLRLSRVELKTPPANAILGGRPGNFQMITVSDTGCGIQPENLQRLFDPFYTTKDVGQGSGLGLPTVLGIVRNHSGFLQVESTPGRGTTFRIFLPEHPSETQPPITAISPQPVGEAQKHILVVDDEPAIRRMLQRILNNQGYRVTLAANGAEALIVLAKEEMPIDLIVADLLMPVLDGASLIHELHRRTRNLPIIAISGNLAHIQMSPELRAAVTALVPKPFEQEKLTALIRSVLKSRTSV
jgi:CheY-like chemotaxis protein